ncbi:hypothetical protein BaRGS_00021166 [Batillaria attramentaria]|uniref:Uncharacterized protein n=1 Tax=Batillaria attramentaria TaxID=370345 RepID=A0ABD0KK67_9CAEN
MRGNVDWTLGPARFLISRDDVREATLEESVSGQVNPHHARSCDPRALPPTQANSEQAHGDMVRKTSIATESIVAIVTRTEGGRDTDFTVHEMIPVAIP